MPGAIGRLSPLRDPQSPYGKSCTSNLRNHHQTHHTNETYLPPVTRSFPDGLTVKGYVFYGAFVKAGKVKNPRIRNFVGGLSEIGMKRESEVATLHLEETFGKATTWEELTVADGFMIENAHEGHVFMEIKEGEIDRILVKTKNGFTMTLIGTNLVEAGVYLPRIYRSLVRRLEKGEIPEGIESVEVEIEGAAQEYAIAASPLRLKLRLPNLSNVSPYELDLVVEQALDRILAKKTNLHLVP